MSHKVGLVGLGQAGSFIPLFNQMPDTRVTALCDIDEELLNQVGEEAGIEQRFTDFDKMLETDIDMVELSTPIQIHGSHAIQALAAGKHVLCQYIAASNPEEGEDLLRAAQASGKKYMFIETDCYERSNMVMMELARRGVLGELTMGRGHYIHDCKWMGRKEDGTSTWRGELWRQGLGGSIGGVHTAMPLLHIFGERVEEVYAYGPGARTMPEYRWNDRITTIGRLPSGRILEFVTDIFSWHPAVCGYYVQGTVGYFEFGRAAFVEGRKLSPLLSLDEIEEKFGLQDLIRDQGGHLSAFEAVVREFVNSIDQDSRPPEDLCDALHITAIGWAADESLLTGQPVKVMSFE